eukprot:Protomagalhaensia_sp_Gyna_25__52@NODE_1024_length_2276_cov_107_556996_g816_i0_p1_GENE_NODE_1024_length_2276_cov_107_556996_g816_i0NODE_1024_length_2276_cov_107_556996_g816_i0_p1_ORF_typecomplete_len412_score66_02Glycos_transf_4/PF00953_21/4_3e03Glycos_transf_4/PF00953_21/4_2e43_NODE_1024_length_2276_cov_107_556996_g816_i05701805
MAAGTEGKLQALSLSMHALTAFASTTSLTIILSLLTSTALYPLTTGTVAFWIVYKLIPSFAVKLKSKGLSGIDINKHPPPIVQALREGKLKAAEATNTLPRIPEALGIVPAFVYLMSGVLCYVAIPEGLESQPYISGLLCVTFITFLGFIDDVIDLRWRYKMVLPLFAALPLITIYNGPTSVVFPSFLKPFVPFRYDEIIIFELGALYKVYMACLIIFCSNAINIYAGINGLEVGQSIVINVFIMFHNAIEIATNNEDSVINQHNRLSLTLCILFLFCTAALYVYNQYPARVFVGDTFTYFAGVHFAVVGIVGHFAKTLLLFFLPQIINFLISCPQLFGLIPCPRHRVPILDEKTGRLVPSPSWTMINVALRIFGPLGERDLVHLLLGFQVACGILALGIRYSPLYSVLFL